MNECVCVSEWEAFLNARGTLKMLQSAKEVQSIINCLYSIEKKNVSILEITPDELLQSALTSTWELRRPVLAR